MIIEFCFHCKHPKDKHDDKWGCTYVYTKMGVECQCDKTYPAPKCDLVLPKNYSGLMGKGDEFRCVICGKDNDFVYFCPCKDDACCIRLCMHCRDARTHLHNKLAHYIQGMRVGKERPASKGAAQ